MPLRIDIDRDKLAAFCRRHHIRKLAFFGSVLREDFGPDSDVDVLVEFEPDAVVGWGIVAIEDDLSELLGRKVDLGTPQGLIPPLRRRVLPRAEVVYERAG